MTQLLDHYLVQVYQNEKTLEPLFEKEKERESAELNLSEFQGNEFSKGDTIKIKLIPIGRGGAVFRPTHDEITIIIQ
jgi:hypothetical protein